MANEEQVRILSQGVQVWNNWREENRTLRPNLKNANLRNTNLVGVDLSNAYLTRAYLWAANLERSNVRGAHLVGASLRNAKLFGAVLSDTKLQNADLRNAEIASANFNGADMRDTKLNGADFTGTEFQGANLSGSDASKANLKDANLSGAKLYRVNFTGTNLTGAILAQARLYETGFINARLLSAKGLDNCVHRGPSCIDHRTLAQSSDIALEFLRGCGLPDFIIDNVTALRGTHIQFCSCFISYSTKDQEFADRLYADLQDTGIRCWFAPHHIRAGRKIHEQIGHAIRMYDRLLIILSDDSMKSEWVKTEIANARQREISERRRVLFPIRLVDFEIVKHWKCLDADTGKDSAREIREYFIPDFSNWRNQDAYRNAFDRLIRDLNSVDVSKD